ncbi:MAG TPA: LuxR C-terminal-related transcriptional regulator [Actinomycetota bacterium]|nr:LuxR C-terminal-related transcriptional regulator [Actinomycetota bacterium]
MNREIIRRTRRDIVHLAGSGLDWVSFAGRTADVLRRAIPFERMCWHPVDPGTLLFTGALTENTLCSGSWLAEHEYVLDDVNKWGFLAGSGYRAGSLSHATHGNLSQSARFRSSESFGQGFADELRGSFVDDGTYWGSAGFIRDRGGPCFSDEEVRFLASLSSPIARGFRRAMLISSVVSAEDSDDAPGMIVFDEQGDVASLSPTAERWLDELVEVPAHSNLHESHVLQVVAATARAGSGERGSAALARSRVQTRSGRWLLLFGTRLSGTLDECTGVIIRPAAAHEIAPLLLDAYGLSRRERHVTRLCLAGLGTREIARVLSISPYTVQDHLKSIFEKTSTRSRAELIGLIFLEQYVPQF